MQGHRNGNIKCNPLFASPAATNPCQHQWRTNVLPKVGVREEEENSLFAISLSPSTSPWHPSGKMRDGLEALFNLEENLEALTVLRDWSGEKHLNGNAKA